MSMRGPFACTECTLGRCVKPLTRCDECEGWTTKVPAGTALTATFEADRVEGRHSGRAYDRRELALKAEKLKRELANLCDWSDVNRTSATHFAHVYNELDLISVSGSFD